MTPTLTSAYKGVIHMSFLPGTQTCCECGTTFTFGVEDSAFFKYTGFTNGIRTAPLEKPQEANVQKIPKAAESPTAALASRAKRIRIIRALARPSTILVF